MKTSSLLQRIILASTLFLGACMGKTPDSGKEMALNDESAVEPMEEVEPKKTTITGIQEILVRRKRRDYLL